MGPAVLFKIGKDHELIKVPISRRGEPHENQDLALRDLQIIQKQDGQHTYSSRNSRNEAPQN